MGDRANICIQEDSGNEIYFYTHWEGHDLFNTLQEALRWGQGRWDDEPYLARIIFSQMVRNDVQGETGFGISTYITDNEYPVMFVNSEKQTIAVDSKEWSFEEFISLEVDPRRE